MQIRHIAQLVFAASLVLSSAGLTFAQRSDKDDAEAPRTDESNLIEESDFKIRLVDEDGNLVAVPNWTLADFDEIREQLRRLKDKQPEAPAFTYDGVDLDGKIDAKFRRIDFDMTFRIHLAIIELNGRATWIAVPLRLDDAFVDLTSAKHDEPGEFSLNRTGKSLVCWLRARPGTSHTIHLSATAAIRRAEGKYHLALPLPNVSTSARITIPAAPVTVTSDRERDDVVAESDRNATHVTIKNAGGGLAIDWATRSNKPRTALDVTGALALHVYGNLVWSEARLTVKSRGQPIDEFVVDLPAGMELKTQDDAHFQFTTIKPPAGTKHQSVRVRRVEGPTADPISITLEAAAPEETEMKPRRSIVVDGFAVQSAARQWGSVDVTVDGNWSVTWLPGAFVQRDAVPADKQDINARFLYYRQPFSLRIDLQQKRPRITAAPTYILQIDDQEVRLEARLNYSTTGPPLDAIELDLPGWEVDGVSPAKLVAEPYQFKSGHLKIPLASAPTDFEIVVRAHHAAAGENENLDLQIPKLADKSATAASIVVLSAENVELTPNIADSKSLVPDAERTGLDLPEHKTAPLFFRVEAVSDEAFPRFVATRHLRPREISATVTSDAELREDSVAITQKFAVAVAYGTMNPLLWEVPQAVLDAETLKFSYRNEDLPFQPQDQDAAEAAKTQVVTPFPDDTPANVEVTASFVLPIDAVATETLLTLPLIQLTDELAANLLGNTLTIHSGMAQQFVLEDDQWTEDTAATAGNTGGSLVLRAAAKVATVQVRRLATSPKVGAATAVSLAWIQTWIAGDQRRDRVCWRFKSNQPQLQLKLPAGAQMDGLHALIDGKPPELLTAADDHDIRITQDPEAIGSEATLEIWYYVARENGLQMHVSLPEFAGVERVDRTYWQLVLPKDRHLAWEPADLTPESSWHSDGFYWGRRGRLEQFALEELLQATAEPAVPAQTNRYLFSSIGSGEMVEFTTIHRVPLMLGVSGIALLLVLPFIYFPVLRHPAAFFIAGVVLIALATTFPEHAILAAQAGAIGLVLALAANVLNQLVGRGPVRLHSLSRGSVYVNTDSQGSGLPLRLSEGSSRATTAAAPVHIPVASDEDEQ